MVTANWYGLGLRKVASGTGPIVWTSDTIKCALMADAYVPDQDTDEFWADISADEASGTGYTAGGETITNRALLAYDTANNRTALDGDDVVWANSTISAEFAVVYKDTGTPATSPLLGYVTFDQVESSSAAAFTITWSADGILRIAAA